MDAAKRFGTEDKRKMSKKKERNTNQGVAIALGLAMLLGITGCADKEAAAQESICRKLRSPI